MDGPILKRVFKMLFHRVAVLRYITWRSTPVLSDKTGYQQGFHQLESSTVKALLIQYGNTFMTDNDVSDFQDKYYDHFFTKYWREAHPLSRIAIVGVDEQDINSAGLAAKARHAFHDKAESVGDSLTTYVRVYDLL